MAFPLSQLCCISAAVTFLICRYAPDFLNYVSVGTIGFVLFSFLTLLFASWSYILYPKYFTPLRRLPQLPGGSFLNGQFGRIKSDAQGKSLREWTTTIPNDGMIYYTMILNSPRVLLTSAAALNEVLVTKSSAYVKPANVRNTLGRVLGGGLFFAEGSEHKRQRKLLSPAFSFRHIKDLYPSFWAKAIEMTSCIHQTISKPHIIGNLATTNVIEVEDWASRATLDIIGLSGMGSDFGSLKDPANELSQTYKKVCSSDPGARSFAVLSGFLPAWLVRRLPIQRNTHLQSASESIRHFARGLIRQKRDKDPGFLAGLDIISAAGKGGGAADFELCNQAMTFLAAGHETTSASVTWAVAELCRRPHIQDRIRAELHEAGLTANTPASTVSAAQIESVPYLSAFCNEVLRVHPPVVVVLREAAHNTSVLGQPIPKGTIMVICPKIMNFSPDLWGGDAADFNPERWLQPGCANTGGARSNYGFMTFLQGPRSCIGFDFAKAEFKCLVAAWVANFRTELADTKRVIEVGAGLTARPKGGLPVRVTPVES